MFAQFILTILIFVLAGFGIWKFLVEPMMDKEQEEPEHLKILNEKLEKAELLRSELEAVKQEKDVTSQIVEADAEIEALLSEISYMERKDD